MALTRNNNIDLIKIVRLYMCCCIAYDSKRFISCYNDNLLFIWSGCSAIFYVKWLFLVK